MLVTRRAVLAGGVGCLLRGNREGDGMSAFSERRGRVAFAGQSGLGVFWPFGGPEVNEGTTTYKDNVYENAGTWAERMTTAIYAMIADAGFDHFRLQPNPGPWLDAMAAGDGARLAYLDGLLDEAVDGSIAAGFGVLIVPFYTGFAGLNAEIALQGLTDAGFLALKALLQHWAARYADRAITHFAIELFNEPPAPERYPASWADTLMPALYAAVRAILPDHTIVLGGASWSSHERLIAIDPAPYGQNVLWTFHPFRPAPVALQGYIYNQYQYVGPIGRGLIYPPEPTQRAIAITDMESRVNADGSLTSGEKAAIITGLTTDLEYYFDTPQAGREWFVSMMQPVADWADVHGLTRAQIHVGEWGIVRTNAGFPFIDVPGYQGADRFSRARYLRDIRMAIEHHGFRPSVIHLDTTDYGLTVGQDDTVGDFDPLLLAAVAPRRVLLKY